jgi:SAM-dependent methyltransferase
MGAKLPGAPPERQRNGATVRRGPKWVPNGGRPPYTCAVTFLELREPGYALLSGTGIEIGGFEHPAKVPQADRLIRCDRFSKAEAARIFTEIDPAALPEVDVIVDLDAGGLKPFADASLDFVICCHVLEHLKNPVHALKEFFRVLRPGGRAALAIPDKRFTFDRDRPFTPWESLEAFYRQDVFQPVPADYLDIVRYLHPQMLQVGEAERQGYLAHLMNRREHLNIWDSAGFEAFLIRALALIGEPLQVLYEVDGDRSQFESFVVLEKAHRAP